MNVISKKQLASRLGNCSLRKIERMCAAGIIDKLRTGGPLAKALFDWDDVQTRLRGHREAGPRRVGL